MSDTVMILREKWQFLAAFSTELYKKTLVFLDNFSFTTDQGGSLRLHC